MATLAQRVKYARMQAKLTLIEAQDLSGVAKSMIHRYEKGQSEAICIEYIQFIHGLGFSLDWLLIGKDQAKRVEKDTNLITDINKLKVQIDVNESILKWLLFEVKNSKGIDTDLIVSNIIKSKVGAN